MAARISLCLIARDEAARIGDCLASARAAVDEIVLVDTGSRDATRELARAAGAVVLDHPWADDFATPRTLAAARATGDYVLVLDADERLAPGGAAAIRAAAAEGGFDVGLLRLHNAARAGATAEEVISGAARAGAPLRLPRLLRRAPDLAWRGAVHESPMEWAAARGNLVRPVAADLVHLGYLDDLAGRRVKADRNLALLRRRMAAEPDDVTAPGYVALELYGRGERAEAAAVAEAAWALVPAQPPHRSLRRLATVRAMLAVERGDPAVALASVEAALAREAPSPDLVLLRGMARELAAFAAAPGSAAREAGLLAAELDDREALRLLAAGEYLQAVLADEGVAGIRLGTVLLAAGRAAEAVTAFEAAVAAGAGDEAAVGRAHALALAGRPAVALAALEPLLGARADAWLAAAVAAAALGAVADARLFLARAAERAAGGWPGPHAVERFRAMASTLHPAGGPP